ncbi:MAG: hypothetical protein JWM85_2727 [Acidimicrobiaceae bacterium]|nr:hypothetical protein [Acidimicrobiaceae bacterium]
MPDPLPQDPELTTYFEGLRRGELLLQRCDDCARAQFPPRIHCTFCGSRAHVWEPSAGDGTVYAKTVNRRAPESAFEHLVPYVVAFVDLDDGVRVLARADAPPERVQTGMRVQVVADPNPPVGDGLIFRIRDGSETQ